LGKKDVAALTTRAFRCQPYRQPYFPRTIDHNGKRVIITSYDHDRWEWGADTSFLARRPRNQTS
jgi:hypothetical protein